MKTTKFYFSPLRSVKIRTPDHTPKQKGRQRRRTSCLADKNLHGDGRQQDPHMLTPSTRQVHPQGFFFPNYVIMTAVFAKYRNGPIRREAAREIRDHYRMGGSALVEQGHKQLYLCHEESTRGERGGGGADGYRISLSREQLAVTEHRLGGGGGSAAAGECGRWAPCRLQQFRQVPGKPQARRGLLPTCNTAVRRESASRLLGVSRLHAKPPAGNWP